MDMTAALQADLDSAIAARRAWSVPAGGNRLTSTGLGYGSNAIINMVGDLYNDHGPLVGTLYCLTNRSSARLHNVTIIGKGGSFVGAATAPNGATRKGLGIVKVDGFVVTGARTDGPLTGFGMEVKDATGGVLTGLVLNAGANVAGADGLHFFGACQRVSGSNIVISSGDDALSFTHENGESMNALMERITLSGLTLNSAAYSCIKFHVNATTGKATIRNIRLSNIKGAILSGPTGCPLIMENKGVAQGCVIDDVVIRDADLTFGEKTTQDGPCAFLTDVSNVQLLNMKLRGRRRGQFLRAIRCRGLTLTGELWETIPGSAAGNMIQLEQCGNYRIDVIVRSATGARLGVIQASNTGVDTGIRSLGITGA
ncbi:hypothetical protein LK533_07885 [Sphingomonas sp. PL-96]|nr:hypothetical protein [Sphingomonas sp. PL-96]